MSDSTADRDQYIASIGEAAGIFADSALRKDRSQERFGSLIRKVGLLLDREIQKLDVPNACTLGCDHCCHRPVYLSPLELAGLVGTLSERLDQAALDGVIERSKDYQKRREAGESRVPCPLLENHQCLGYEARPVVCRGTHSLDVAYCRQWREAAGAEFDPPQNREHRQLGRAVSQGLRGATAHHGLEPDPVELGAVIGQALDDETLLPRYFRHEVALTGDPDRQRRFATLPGEPSGFLPAGKSVDRYLDLLDQRGDTPAALELLRDAEPTVRDMLSMVVPRVYRSTDEIEEWLARWDVAFERLSNSTFDPKVAFNALGCLLTFELAYHGRDVKERLSKLGDLVVERIAKPLFPDLSEPITKRRRPGRPRVGYISYALRNNNGGKWALGWLRRHSDDIETYAFNLYSSEDFISARFRESADHYYHLPDDVPAAARLIKSLDLDVLIYTDLGMCARNTQFACFRLARTQATAWGHPVTSGLSTVDAYLSSALMEPADGDEHYREKLVRLPNSGLCLQRVHLPVSDRSRADFGLPEGFLPIVAQNLMKCIPEWDDLILKVQEKTGGPIVVLSAISPYEQAVTKERFERAGINAIWVPRLAPQDFRRLVQLCDVSLDPPPWSGGNTTVETMAMGTPVVTLPTRFMRGRHSLAFHQMAGADALVAKDRADYVRIATDRDLLKSVMEACEPESVFDDPAPAEALNDFCREAARGV